MKVVTGNEMLKCEKSEINQRRFTVDDMVLSVALTLEDHIIKDEPKSVTIICGGERQADYGMNLASLLARDTNYLITVCYLDYQQHRYYSDMSQQHIEFVNNLRVIKQKIEEADYIVDCLYGIELNERVSYPFNYFIEWINASKAYVVSCDIPSGMDADDGSIFGCCVEADATVCLQLPKMGLFLYPGSTYVGELFIEEIGISFDSLQQVKTDIEMTEQYQIRNYLPKRVKHSHKGTYGKVLLIAGSKGKTGACILAGKSILKTGAGLLTIMSYEKVCDTVNAVLYEAMTIPMDDGNVRSTFDSLDWNNYDLIVMGPGLGRDKNTEYLTKAVLKTEKPVVLDADGLFYLKENLNLLNRDYLTVITPHQGEYSRIWDYHKESIIPDLQHITRLYSNLVVVFKGENTLIAHQGHININTIGNNSLAKGGSGDCLTGIISGLLAQKMDYESVVCGVYVHAMASDYWVREHSHYSLLASEVCELADKVLYDLSESK